MHSVLAAAYSSAYFSPSMKKSRAIWLKAEVMVVTMVLFLSLFKLSLGSDILYDGPKCIRDKAFIPSSKSMDFFAGLTSPLPFEKFIVDFFEKQPIVLRRRKPTYYGGLLQVDDIDKILLRSTLSHNNSVALVYGKDYKLVRRVQRDGQWWSGVYPESNMTLDNTRAAFAKGFSLVINEVQRHWATVHQATSLVEEALGYRVSANLYLTPASSQGFEAHFDWMDGLVLQLAGRKTWQVYSPPSIFFPRPDLMFRPADIVVSSDQGNITKESQNVDGTSSNSNSSSAGSIEEVQSFSLETGDLTYLPRGVSHEATTLNATASDPERSDDDMSLHLTLGVEVATHYSVEMLLHHLVDVSVTEMDTSANGSDNHSLCSDGSSDICFHLNPPPNPADNNNNNNKDDNKDNIKSRQHVNNRLILHLLLSWIGSLTELPGSMLLRRAVGVTVLSVEVPALNPLHTTKTATDFVLSHMRSLSDAGNLTVSLISYLMQRRLLHICSTTAHNSDSPNNPVNLLGSTTGGRCLEAPARPANALSADYKLTYLMRFLGKRDSPIPDEFSFLGLYMTTPNDGSVADFSSETEGIYAVDMVDSVVRGMQWGEMDGWLLRTMSSVFQPIASLETTGDDSVFCGMWSAFMSELTEHRRMRQESTVSSLLAAGQKVLYGNDAGGGGSGRSSVHGAAKKKKKNGKKTISSEL
eukprot:gene1108-2154_t